MQNNGHLAAGPAQRPGSPPPHAHGLAYHMSAPLASAAPGASAAAAAAAVVKAEDQGRAHKVESLVHPGGAGQAAAYHHQRPGDALREHLHSNSSSSTNISPAYASADPQPMKPEPAPGVAAYGRSNGPGSPHAGRAQFYAGGASPDASRSPVRPQMGSFPPPQQQQPPYRRTRQHAATISDPMVSPSGLHRLQQQQQQQQPQGFRYYSQHPQQHSQHPQHPQHSQHSQHSQHAPPHRLPPPPPPPPQGFPPPPSAGAPDMRPRRLSFIGTPLAHEHRTDHYETSFSRSTSTAHAQAQSYGQPQQQSPQGAFFPAYASNRQGPPHMLPPPPASAPAHQLHFGAYSPRGAAPPGAAYAAAPPAKRSLSPQPLGHRRHHLPVPGRFDGPAQRSPLPFPRIPSPSQQNQSQNQNQNQNQAQSSQSPARESSRRLSSVVWGPTGFERLESGMSRCRMCAKEYSKGSSTGTLKRHYRQHQVNVATPGSSNASAGAAGNPYARPSSPAAPAGGGAHHHHAPSRPRAYSHRTDTRARREMSPFSPLQQMMTTTTTMQPPPIMQQMMTQPQPQTLPVLPARRPDAPSEMDTSSAIAGSALLSMAAGGADARRPMRSSDPSVYAHASAGASAAEPGTRDISVSPSPTSSPLQSALANRRAAHLGFDEADEDMDVEDSDSDLDDDADADDATAAAMHQPRRRATVAGVQRVPPLALAPASASDLARDIGALSATQMVALSSELVRRVATALPLLAEEARHHRHHAPHNGHHHHQSASSDAVVENPLDVLFGHIRASLLTPDFSGLLLSSPQHFPSVSSDCDPPFTLRRADIISNPAAMTTTAAIGLLSRVSASMQRIAPLSLAELDWDNVGILLEAAQPKPDAKKVFLTIDLTSTTLNEALADLDVGVIVAYHPPIFSAWKSLSMGNLKQSLVLKCAAAGVSIYSPHTSLDSCADGINDWLASLVVDPTTTTGGGGGTVVPIAPAAPEKAAGQDNVGTGRLVELATPRPLSDIVRALKARLSLDHMRVARAPCHQQGGEEKLVSRIAICAGSGASVLRSVSAADLYFTGEMDHHSILAAVEQGISCVLAEHTNTERGYLRAVLQRRLQEELGGGDEEPVSVVVSESDKDPITIE